MHEVILSVGIDIGTSTTQLIFSRLTIENRASSYTVPRIQIVEKEVIYRSLIYFTPLKSSTEIDAEAVKKIVRDEYKAAGMTPEDVKTGAEAECQRCPGSALRFGGRLRSGHGGP